MQILLKLVLDCSADAAWDAVRSPRGMQQVSAPLTTFESLEPGGFPPTWSAGEHTVRISSFGGVTVGDQVIGISYPEREDDVRVQVDTGRGLSGPLALVTKWQHSIAIAPAPHGRTLYRDQLVFEAGALTPLLWLGYWAFWQWRGARIRALAPSWEAHA
ncbi:hypothetical protein [Frigoribacterium sp. CG_9.8]|jgi:hypothetical protein|uniref:hypothetical protein n=1 Tax=Frigoribacterium sp. CG_9.8 TaxID=2787733 RepID=UPI0018C9705E|nr:hypothetical protein [Frigoribacterium sp. CG_9.8]MBG6108857.1 hypothetical protein [Frigoribacterium sp. CG_9.8]